MRLQKQAGRSEGPYRGKKRRLRESVTGTRSTCTSGYNRKPISRPMIPTVPLPELELVHVAGVSDYLEYVPCREMCWLWFITIDIRLYRIH